MGFWKDEKCEYCNGPIVERVVDLPRKTNSRYVLVKNVPVGVCRRCGTRYLAANVLKSIEVTIRRKKKEKSIPMAVYSLK